MISSIASALLYCSPTIVCVAMACLLFKTGHPYAALPFYALAGMGACYIG